ncbi:Sec-independent protein translocase protein TatB [Hyphomicrobium sp. CS1GBMeth3]|uniref:Sec-independent protein translocase protein TatB n=1 Tax=Hyphomicrobium sp. CS1GBMeth3 TaxID=1892845 RepID=UPI00092FFED4|nr:Sec-independent protein translocase protein TatB [Hyphomicrobium sp. CS1GBMeth3]
MFDVSWSELLILGLVALVVVGPKELPRFLNTLGKYAGVVKRQANEFRAVFEQAMREAEMEDIRKEVNSVRDGVKASLDQATRSVEGVKDAAKVDIAAAAPPAQIASDGTSPAESVPAVASDAPPAATPVEPDPVAAPTESDKEPEAVSSTSKAGAA